MIGVLQSLAITAAGAAIAVRPLHAQAVSVAGSAVVSFDRVDRTPRGGGEGELRIVHPILGVRVRTGPFGLAATANLEGLTLPDGQLSLGSWGEGFVDRRHPHTYVHELIVDARVDARCGASPCRLGAFLGKGFVPFGSADPMTRPPLRYPVNHHLAQILERAVAGAQLGWGPALLELALFNGDEPERPGQWPRVARFGDSWAARAVVTPIAGLELSGSVADVASPEHRPGAGGSHHKTHLGATWRHPGASGISALGEWARTSELDGFFVFESWLGELQWGRGPVAVHYRLESTDRPEESRVSRFRSTRPHLENSNLGSTRWTIHTIGGSLDLVGAARPGRASLVAEISRGEIEGQTGGAFTVPGTYGAPAFWSLAVGVQLDWSVSNGAGTGHAMGRYGVRAAGSHHP